MVIAQLLHRIRSDPDSSPESSTGRNPLLAPRRKINSLTVRRLSRSRRDRRFSSGGAPCSHPMSPTRLIASYDDVVIKSPNDRRSYRILHLPNGLFALLVHDPEIYSDKYPSQSEDRQAPEEDEDMEEVGSDNEEEEEETEDGEEEDDDEELDSSEEEDEKKGADTEVNRKKNKEQTVKKVNFVLLFFCFQLSL